MRGGVGGGDEIDRQQLRRGDRKSLGDVRKGESEERGEAWEENELITNN